MWQDKNVEEVGRRGEWKMMQKLLHETKKDNNILLINIKVLNITNVVCMVQIILS